MRPRGRKHIDQLVPAFHENGDLLVSTVHEVDIHTPGPVIDVWQPETGTHLRTVHEGSSKDSTISIYGLVCPFHLEGRLLVACTSYSGQVVVKEARKGRTVAKFSASDHQIGALCAVARRGQTALATTSLDGMVRLWEPLTGRPLVSLDCGGQFGDNTSRQTVGRLCPVPVAGRSLLAATTLNRGMVQLWDADAGTLCARLNCHPDNGNAHAIGALCAFTLTGRAVLATGGSDRTVRLWDALREELLLEIPVHHSVSALAYGRGLLAVGTAAGLLTLRLGTADPVQVASYEN